MENNNDVQNTTNVGNEVLADVSGSLLTLKRSTGCGICGGKMVYIRGKYPKDKKRKICPTCAYERLEQINEISSRDYGKCYQSNDR